MKRPLAMAACVAALGLLAGCRGRTESSQPVRIASQQDGLEMTVSTDRSVIRVADPLAVTVQVSADELTHIDAVTLSPGVSDFTAVDVDAPETRTVAGRRIQTRRFVLESYLGGEREIAPFVVQYQVANSPTTGNIHRMIRSPAIPVQVTSLVGRSADLRQFRDDVNIIDPRRGWSVGMFTAIGVSIMVAVGIAIARFMARLPGRSGAPSREAMWQLDGLEPRGSIDPVMCRQSVVAADLILRQFLVNRWRLPESQATAEEIGWAAGAQRELSDRDRESLRSALRFGSRVKFARAELAPRDANEHISEIRRLIAGIDQPAAARSSLQRGRAPFDV